MFKRLQDLRIRWRKVVASVAELERSQASADQRLGNVEHCLDTLISNPKYSGGVGVGLNGQRCRKEVFEQIHRVLNFDAIIETGTFMGNSTGYFSQITGATVYTCELSPRFLALAKLRLEQLSNIQYFEGDSRSFLKEMTTRLPSDRRSFFYLDAHWYDDLPLTDEIDIICGHWKNPVIMIDDFMVPKDSGYGFDNYGKGKTLSLGLIQRMLDQHHQKAYFPKALAIEETGAKRGYVLITNEPLLGEHAVLRNLIEPA